MVCGDCLVHPSLAQVTDRKSINFDEAGERLVMGSLAAFKGKDWRAVILLDCTEGVLPSKSSVHTTKEVRPAVRPYAYALPQVYHRLTG